MTKHYVLIISSFSFLKHTTVFNAAFLIGSALKSIRLSIMVVFRLLFGSNTSQQNISRAFSNSIFKVHPCFTNPHLAFASSHGIGGGGGGGHGVSHARNIANSSFFQVFSFHIQSTNHNSI